MHLSLSPVRHGLRLAVLATSIGLGFQAFATPADLHQLIRQGQLPQALELIDRTLLDTPRDPPSRFLRGGVLT